MLVNQFLEQYTDESLKRKIFDGFALLISSNLIFNMEKRNRLKFNLKFNEFCIKTYGLLSIR